FFQAEDGIRDPLVTGVQTCALPIWPIGRTGVTKSCSNVPRSFSRTIENAVRKVVTFNSRMAVSPGKKKFGERESGLKSSFGRMRSEERRVGKEGRARRGRERKKRQG